MRLTPSQWGLRAPITPRLGGNGCGAHRALAANRAKNKPTLNKLRILPHRGFPDGVSRQANLEDITLS